MNKLKLRLAAAAALAIPLSAFSATSIVAWGDSLTLGAAPKTGTTKSYPAQLAQLMNRTVVNQGIGNQTSREIAARQGGAPALLTFPGDALPPKGSATTTNVSVFPITLQGPAAITGTIQGVHGKLTAGTGPRGSPQLVFTRGQIGTTIAISSKTPFHPDTFGTESWINVFWMGRIYLSNASQVVADVSACANTLTTNHFIVLSVLNGADEGMGSSVYSKVMTLNSQLSQMFPNNYLNVRSALVAAYDPANSQDVADHSADTVPASLRIDRIHLTPQGYGIVAARVADFITQRRW